jgi:hypothetical protein
MLITGKIKVDSDGDIAGCCCCDETDETYSNQRILELEIVVPDDFFDPVPVSLTIVNKQSGDGVGEIEDEAEAEAAPVPTETEEPTKKGWFTR